MKKKELLEFVTQKCMAHQHYYRHHENCWIKEKGHPLKIGYFDIETTNLDSQFGFMLTYCIKTKDKDEYVSGHIYKSDIQSGIMDKNLVERCIRDMQKYNVIIGWYSSRFDLNFVRSRALYHKLDFPHFNELLHKDLWYIAKSKLKLKSNSLENVGRLLGITDMKTHLSPYIWQRAGSGHIPSIQEVLHHNKMDCALTERVHQELEKFVKNINRSI